jgi:hypothetical protein
VFRLAAAQLYDIHLRLCRLDSRRATSVQYEPGGMRCIMVDAMENMCSSSQKVMNLCDIKVKD